MNYKLIDALPKKYKILESDNKLPLNLLSKVYKKQSDEFQQLSKIINIYKYTLKDLKTDREAHIKTGNTVLIAEKIQDNPDGNYQITRIDTGSLNTLDKTLAEIVKECPRYSKKSLIYVIHKISKNIKKASKTKVILKPHLGYDLRNILQDYYNYSASELTKIEELLQRISNSICHTDFDKKEVHINYGLFDYFLRSSLDKKTKDKLILMLFFEILLNIEEIKLLNRKHMIEWLNKNKAIIQDIYEKKKSAYFIAKSI